MLRNSAAFLAPLMAVLLVTACDGREKDTGPDVSPDATVPAVAASEPPVTEVPPSQNPLASFDRLDAGHDGKISSAEYAQGAQTLFEMMDMEHNGNLSLDELTAGAALLAQTDGLTAQKLMSTADTDSDDNLTLAEWMAFNNSRFTQIDANGDGLVDRNEWNAARPPLR